MSHTPHELAEDFPEMAAEIHRLKDSDAHFARLADEYHRLNREVHRAETHVAPMDEAAETQLRRRRAQLKDEIYGLLRAAQSTR